MRGVVTRDTRQCPSLAGTALMSCGAWTVGCGACVVGRVVCVVGGGDDSVCDVWWGGLFVWLVVGRTVCVMCGGEGCLCGVRWGRQCV